MIEKTLKELGFSEKEILIYLALVKEKNASVLKISKNTKLPRSTVYDLLEKLIQKGLVSKSFRANEKSFHTNTFNKFLSQLKEKELLAKIAIKELHEIKSFANKK